MTVLTFVTKFFIYSLTTTTTATSTQPSPPPSSTPAGTAVAGIEVAATTGEGTQGTLHLESQVHFLSFLFALY